jgi:hypothetical protein
MKTVTLADQIRTAAKANREIVLPDGGRTNRSWPLCMQCLHEVDAVELMDASTTGCEIKAKCHDKEDYYKVTWTLSAADTGKDILDDVNVGWAIKRAMADFSPFMPENMHDFSSKR